MNIAEMDSKWDLGPIIADVDNLLWFEPRAMIEEGLLSYEMKDSSDYFIGMSVEESAFLCGLIRDKRPDKILELGVHKGGTTSVILKALELLNSSASLYSIDINRDSPACDSLKRVNCQPARFVWKYGRDISAYISEIGENIDFCILDTAHYLPGEVLNFLCILPYLKVGATVVIHDQVHHFDVDAPYVKFIGSSSIIACRILFDTVVADKFAPNFCIDGGQQIPNIAAFTVTPDTFKYIRDIFSVLMLPWRIIPGGDYLSDVLSLFRTHYPSYYTDYFLETIRRQIRYHLEREDSARHYWGLTMLELQSVYGLEHVAFYGAGSYCGTLINRFLPSDLLPKIVIDSVIDSGQIGSVPICHVSKLPDLHPAVSVLVITSNAHHQEIQAQLAYVKNIGIDVVNVFVSPYYSHLMSFLQKDQRYRYPLW